MTVNDTAGTTTQVDRTVSRAGWVCAVAGLLGFAAGLFMIVVDPAVGEDSYSYPFDTAGFTGIQVFFFVHHLGLLAGLYGLWRSGAAGMGRLGRWGTVAAIVGMVLLSVTELVAISGAESAYPSDRTDVLDAMYGLSSNLIGAALVVAGVAVIRAGRWAGWQRYVPLLVGVYQFVPMTPMIFSSYLLARLGIGGWMLGFAVLGWALVTTSRDAAPRR